MDGTGAIKGQRMVCMAAGQGPCGTVMGDEAEKLGGGKPGMPSL